MIAPGATIGILGGGQLGRMTALAARSMGYRIHVLDPDGSCATAPIADRAIAAAFNDADAARDFARHCDVITLEIEQIATAVLDAAAHYAPTRPGSAIIGAIQDRAKQKEWLRSKGFPIGPYRDIRSTADLGAALDVFRDTFVKSCHGGYDGRSQVRLTHRSAVGETWAAMGERPAVAEQALDLAGELSVLVARRPSGELRVYPAALNHHERHILAWSVIPAPLSAPVLKRAEEIARGIAETFSLEGLIAVEMFLTKSGDILVNELAPRPHNSYHASERACVTSQFEQVTRAVCDLPLGDTSVVRPAAIVNLFGDLWPKDEEPDFSASLRDPMVRLHLYGKRGPRPGRKMGHLSAVGPSPLEALEAVRAAGACIGATSGALPHTLAPFIAKG